jgi:hypothetical protein
MEKLKRRGTHVDVVIQYFSRDTAGGEREVLRSLILLQASYLMTTSPLVLLFEFLHAEVF